MAQLICAIEYLHLQAPQVTPSLLAFLADPAFGGKADKLIPRRTVIYKNILAS